MGRGGPRRRREGPRRVRGGTRGDREEARWGARAPASRPTWRGARWSDARRADVSADSANPTFVGGADARSRRGISVVRPMTKCPTTEFVFHTRSWQPFSDVTNGCTSRSFEGPLSRPARPRPRARRTARAPPSPPRTRPRVSNPARAALPGGRPHGQHLRGVLRVLPPRGRGDAPASRGAGPRRVLRRARARANRRGAAPAPLRQQRGRTRRAQGTGEDAPAERRGREKPAAAHTRLEQLMTKPKRPTAETEPASGDAGRAPDEKRGYSC